MKIKCLRLVIAFFLVQKFDIFLFSADGFFSKNTSLSFYTNNAKTFATDLRLPLGQVKFSLTPENYNLGISAFSDKIAKSYPFCFKFGNLSAGGSLSKMNNPLLSTSTSPFSSGISSVNCITSSLPGYSSFSNPVSFFCQFSNSNKKSPLFQWKTNCFYSPEEENLAFSLHLSKKLLQKKTKIEWPNYFRIFPLRRKFSFGLVYRPTLLSPGKTFLLFLPVFCGLIKILFSFFAWHL